MSLQLQPRSNNFVRYALELANSNGDALSAHAAAAAKWGETSTPVRMLKAAAEAGTNVADSSSWGSELALAAGASSEFIEVYRARSIVENVRGMARSVPFGVSIPMETDAAVVSWVAAGSPKPLTQAALSTVGPLAPLKVAAIAIITRELARSAKAEQITSRILSNAAIRATDQTFLSADAATDASPAGILAGVTPVASSGNATEDVGALFAAFGGNVETAVLIMRPGVAAQLGLSGASQFADVGGRGGSLAGVPIMTSNLVGGDSSGSNLILLDVAQLALALGDLLDRRRHLRVGPDGQ